MQNANDLRFAVLIDADNVPYTHVKGIMEEISRYGTPTFKRIYGDWTKPHVSGWKGVLLENGITPIQQYSYTTGKNATDSAMIIDAMDILYTSRVDGFCLVSSDSDFTRLALRLREAGVKVIGMGQRKTPSPFIAACDRFIYIEVLAERTRRQEREGERREAVPDEPASDETIKRLDRETIQLIADSVSDVADESGWGFLGDVGSIIMRKMPDFDPRNYGFKKLGQLIKSIDLLETDERMTDKGNIKLVYVKIRPVPKPAPKKAPHRRAPTKKS